MTQKGGKPMSKPLALDLPTVAGRASACSRRGLKW